MKMLTSRRSLLITMGLGAAATVIRDGWAAETPKLDPKDPAGAAVGYVENASQVDTKKYPAYAKDSNCANCLLLLGKAGSDYRPCRLFPGKLVAVAGWCSSWTAEM